MPIIGLLAGVRRRLRFGNRKGEIRVEVFHAFRSKAQERARFL